MMDKRAFRPSCRDGLDMLDRRCLTSHLVVTHLVAPISQAAHRPNDSAPEVAGVHLHVPKLRGGVGRRQAVAGIHTFPKHAANLPTSIPTPTNPAVSASPATSVQGPAAPSYPSTVGIPSVSGVMSAVEQAIVGLVNSQRQQAGLAPLSVDSRLVKAAQIQSADMAALGTMEHELPGAALSTVQSRANFVGYNYTWYGENIAFNYADANSVMNGWMNSPEHRANILNPNFTQIGVGVAVDQAGEPYYTQEFGQPA